MGATCPNWQEIFHPKRPYYYFYLTPKVNAKHMNLTFRQVNLGGISALMSHRVYTWRVRVCVWRVRVYVWGVEVTSHMESVCLCTGSGGDQSHGECVSMYGEWR